MADNKKARGERDATTRGGAQPSRVNPDVLSFGSGLFADVKGLL
jgi:hypothetical protein